MMDTTQIRGNPQLSVFGKMYDGIASGGRGDLFKGSLRSCSFHAIRMPSSRSFSFSFFLPRATITMGTRCNVRYVLLLRHPLTCGFLQRPRTCLSLSWRCFRDRSSLSRASFFFSFRTSDRFFASCEAHTTHAIVDKRQQKIQIQTQHTHTQAQTFRPEIVL